MAETKLSQKYQIVLPRENRQAMQVKAGDRLLVKTIHGVTVIIPKPKNPSRHLRGLSKKLYSTDYLTLERQAWER